MKICEQEDVRISGNMSRTFFLFFSGAAYTQGNFDTRKYMKMFKKLKKISELKEKKLKI